ncbi:MAG: phosphatidylserine decarboxylase family protein [Chlorobi bacterium]|nr:phosphatidylserine decarboxylase family protein [Chlorobiota bacterium]
MTIHREGTKTIIIAAVILAALNIAVFTLAGNCKMIKIITAAASGFAFYVITAFFRKPDRQTVKAPGEIIAPADGTIVVIEETTENEYFKDKRIQVSIFMSVWNVHINYYPVSGIIKYFKYAEGKYLLARNPKSSEENERTTVVIQTPGGTEILYRQIAGIVARRIVSYAEEGKKVEQSEECGFIKFGSRVDIFLPLDSEIKVNIGDKVKGSVSTVAKLKNT